MVLGSLPRRAGQTLVLSRCESKVDDWLRGTEATRAMQWLFVFLCDLTSNFQNCIINFGDQPPAIFDLINTFGDLTSTLGLNEHSWEI